MLAQLSACKLGVAWRRRGVQLSYDPMMPWVHPEFPWDRNNVGSSRSECPVQVGIYCEIRTSSLFVVWLLVSSCGGHHHITGFRCFQEVMIWFSEKGVVEQYLLIFRKQEEHILRSRLSFVLSWRAVSHHAKLAC
jgi:hypothetical protein